ncbi:MAG: phosphoglycerate kinase, partial [Desulfobacterales bacterium]
IKDIDAYGKRVLVRADLNVPLEDGRISDDTRIKACLPTLRYLIEKSASVILCSHLGRPKGKVVAGLRLDPVADRLSKLLGRQVKKASDCIGSEVQAAIGDLGAGEILLLENTRFHPEEKNNDPDFAKALARHAEIFVNDAFAAAHRAHASTEGVAHYLPAVAGLLMEREIETLSRVVEHPEHPLVAILGGAKVSDKVGVIEKLLETADSLLIGGAMANIFLKSKKIDVGKSPVEREGIEVAGRILEQAADKISLPVDCLIVKGEISADSERRVVSVDEIPTDWIIADIGPKTLDLFKEKLKSARMVVWNGPPGVFEKEPFSKGTMQLARELAGLDAATIVGGGDTGAAVAQAGVTDKMTHVSTGGGAFLEFLEGKDLPGIAALENKYAP